MRGIILAGTLLFSSVFGLAQEGNTVLNRPLKNINYMSVNTRLGYGIGKPTMNLDNNWSVRASVITYFGLGYNFVMKNNWGVDVQINQELGKFTYGNLGPEFKSGYSTTGVEFGLKKSLYKKSDDTFFIRAAFGYNFLVIANDNNTSLNADGEVIYTYSTAGNSSNMYVIPELCYQFRFPSGNHILDFSVGYKYSLSDVATVDMTFLDSGNLNEQNSSNLTGRFIGASVRYSFLFKGIEKKNPTPRRHGNHI